MRDGKPVRRKGDKEKRDEGIEERNYIAHHLLQLMC
jgi:hypothetical protein